MTVVYPVYAEKWICWIDKETGECAERRRSSKKGKAYDVFPELHAIRSFLKQPGFRLKIAMLKVEEYRYLDGFGKDRKKRATKADVVPTEFTKEIAISCIQDYLQFVPVSLEEFTAKEFAKEAAISTQLAQYAVAVLYHIGILTRTGKEKNAYVYQVMENPGAVC